MKQQAFFKLPTIATCIFIIVTLAIWLGMIFINDYDNYYFKYYEYYEWLIIEQVIYIIPPALLVWIMTTLAFHRNQIYLATEKNVVHITILIMIICLFNYVIMWGINIGLYYLLDLVAYDFHWLYSGLRVTPYIVECMIICFVLHLMINQLANSFDQEHPPLELDATNCRRLHFHLTNTTIIFMLISLYTLIIVFFNDGMYHYDSDISVITYLFLLSVLVIYCCVFFFTRNSFKTSFTVLQGKRIIKSALLFNTLLIPLFLLINSLFFFLFIIIAFSARYGNEEIVILAIFILSLIIQFILFGFIARKVVRRYFG